MKRPLKIIYSAGPGDVIRTYRDWTKGQDDSTQLSMTYSGMFYDVCRQNGDEAYVISSCPRRDEVNDPKFRIVYRNTPFANGPGPLFYLGQEWAALRFIFDALWFGADVAVVACGTVSWVTLRLLPWFGVPVVPSLHCVLWPPYRPQSRLQRVLRWMRVPFFKKSVFRFLSASEEITTQLDQLTGGEHAPVQQFLPSYRRAQFDGLADPPADRGSAFNVLFAGRIERNKGVFDLLTIAKRFDAAGERAIQFDLCGEGSALEGLRQQVKELGFTDRFRCHGHCDRKTMRTRFEAAHVVVVPTTGDFVEGFNQVVAESVLAGRPVVTSDVCPALTYVRDAIVEVPVDDVQAYGDAILKLKNDVAFYDARRAACKADSEQFYDMGRSWQAALSSALDQIRATPSDEESLITATGAN
ncbi:MAG: glycosyltransferase [Phycisphaerae bacterium]|nr:glycosyltransferase [Phycisphaerae bacterium]